MATIWKKYLVILYQEGEAASLNCNNNPDMQEKVVIRDEFNKTLKLMKKCKAHRIRRINIQTGNKLLEQVKYFKYLGSLIN